MGKMDLVWLAGIMDADGYFTIQRNTNRMRLHDCVNPTFHERVGIKQVVPVAADLLKELFGGSRSLQKPSARNGQPLHGWYASDKVAATVAKALLPYLRIKREQAAIILELRAHKNRPRSERQIQDGTFVMLNRWGKPVTMPRMVSHPKALALRADLQQRIRSLNDVRTHQPYLV